MRIAEQMIVRAPTQAAWERIGDPTRWPRDLGRMRCSHVAGSPDPGIGARYWLHLEVGAAEVGSLIEVTEYEPQGALSWTTIQGFEQRGHWRLRDRGGGRTEVTLIVSYQAVGGLAALVTDELASPFIRRYLREALGTLARRLDPAAANGRATGARALLGRSTRALGEGINTANAIRRARLARPLRPDRYARSLAALAR